MDDYLMIARSVTYAQRIERVLARAGIRSAMFRAPLELVKDEGCAYAVRISAANAAEAMVQLHKNGLAAVRWIRLADGGAEEVLP